MNAPHTRTDPGDVATMADVSRLMELDESIRDLYAEKGRLKRRINATVARHRQAVQRARDQLMADRAAEMAD